jgi:hypothetical protein
MLDMRPLIEAIADAVVDRLQRAQQKMIPQGPRSDLSPKRHREAVKRRMRNGEGGAGIDGRKHLLTPEAIREELARGDATPSQKRKPQGSAPVAPPPPKSRAREMNDFERDLMNGLRDVK